MALCMQYGYLTTTILKNWSFDPNKPEEWNTLPRTMVTAPSGIERGIQQEFRGIWLVIDEFNRAPIDLALGDAMTALGGNDVLRVSIEGGSAELPIPLDFRVIGTLNSFSAVLALGPRKARRTTCAWSKAYWKPKINRSCGQDASNPGLALASQPSDDGCGIVCR